MNYLLYHMIFLKIPFHLRRTITFNNFTKQQLSLQVIIMLYQTLSIVTQFIDELNDSLQALKPEAKLSFIQRTWLRTVLMGIVVLVLLNWAAFERRSLGAGSQSQEQRR